MCRSRVALPAPRSAVCNAVGAEAVKGRGRPVLPPPAVPRSAAHGRRRSVRPWWPLPGASRPCHGRKPYRALDRVLRRRRDLGSPGPRRSRGVASRARPASPCARMRTRSRGCSPPSLRWFP